MGMVDGPLTKVEAAACCGCNMEDLCPGPLAGIDEGDKIRTIYDGSVGGANDTIRNQTVERTTAPPREGDRQTSTRGLAMAGAGHQVGAAQGGRHQGPPESEGPQEALAVPGGLTGGRMVGEQGRHIRHGQCPILLGTPGSPSPPGPLRTLPSSGLELRLCG